MKISMPAIGGFTVTALLFCLAVAGAAAAHNPFTLVRATAVTLTPAEFAAAQMTDTKGKVSADKKALAFQSESIRIVAFTGPDNDMLSYRIEGLRNPILVVPRGATLKLLFVNTDDDMYHNIRFGVAQESFPNVMDALAKASVGAAALPHKTDTALYGEDMVIHLPFVPGDYAYFCTVRGHAQGGMWGLVRVR